ncbi:MAG: hypothetical protein AABY22_34900 [Nanoarchaeota archaeon]
MIEVLESVQKGNCSLSFIKYSVDKVSYESRLNMNKVYTSVLLFKIVLFRPYFREERKGYNVVRNFKEYQPAKCFFDYLSKKKGTVYNGTFEGKK